MAIYKAFKYRMYPTPAQEVLLNKHFGAVRFVYNLALETKSYAYRAARINLSTFTLQKQLTDLKQECEWLYDIDSQVLQDTIHRLDAAFTHFFKGRCGYPSFKSKYQGHQSFTAQHGERIELREGLLYQAKFREGIRVMQGRPLDGPIKSTTISRTPTGKYFVSVVTKKDNPRPTPKPIRKNTMIGIDLGVKSFMVTSNGQQVENPRHLGKSIKHLAFVQRQLSKKTKGGKNRNKARHSFALCHEKIANQRKDFLHKLSTKLVSENQTLCFEDLNISGMAKNHSLARAINDVGWGMFVEFCKYKADWKGVNILQISRFAPSSKTCNECGFLNTELTLDHRVWTCVCGIKHDRDINAARNIKAFALKQHRDGVRREKPVELPTLVGATKQEVVTHAKSAENN